MLVETSDLHAGVCLGGSQWGGEVTKNSNCNAGNSNYKNQVVHAENFRICEGYLTKGVLSGSLKNFSVQNIRRLVIQACLSSFQLGVGVCLGVLQRINQPLLCCMILYIVTLGLALYTVHMHEGKVCQLFTGFVIFANIVIC